jgi:hypothetical protein
MSFKKTDKPVHTHDFVETHLGFVGFGLDRKTDEEAILYYLQKFSDDTLMRHLIPHLSDSELEEIFSLVTSLLKKHLTEPDYHRLFLKDKNH